MMEQNSAKYGGGIFMAGGHPSSVLNIDGGSFTNMQAAEFGGAIYADKSDSGSINVVGVSV
jgi:predicted outer membrane repeat protein